MLTLRQIEVIRAIMITGTISGAAKLLVVSAPGISRLMKHTEKTLRLKLFERRHGRYVPTPEANDIFEQINGSTRRSTTSTTRWRGSSAAAGSNCGSARCRASAM